MISPTLAGWRRAYLGSAMLKPAKSLIMISLSPFPLSLISLMVSVGVKHHAYLLCLHKLDCSELASVSILIIIKV